MSVIRSVSTSELSSNSLNTNEGVMNESTKQNIGDGICTEGTYPVKQEIGPNNDLLLTSKTQTLDRFSRPSSISQHGEKRKKSLFASFRLSKKSFGKGKEDHGSSGSDLSQTPEKPECPVHSQHEQRPGDEQHRWDEKTNSGVSCQSKPRKHYLNRMSSFVNRVANRVQGADINPSYGLRNKLERSQTVTGTDLMSNKVDYVIFEENQIPGSMGIRNHGNTCFINAVIQCLSHTDILAEYFVLDQYKNDLARCNRINSKKFGTRGEITEHLATLLKSLWVLRYVPDISLNLKNIVEKYEPCYRGSNQHDAAEFLMFILDRVHEDLNTASKRKYKKVKNSYGRPDEIVAAETLANHLRCNSSFVQDIFQAQFRSSLKCPHCLKESNTFDPYLCVSIPIPQNEVISVFVTIVYLNQQPKQVKIGVTIEASSTVKQLRSIISADCGICMDQLILTELDGEGFHRTFSDNACVNIIKSTDPIYAIELTSPNSSILDGEGFLHIVWMNVLIAEPSNIRFGGVYQTQIARDVTYPDLQKLLLKEMSTMVSVATLVTEQDNGIFSIGVDNGTNNISAIGTDLDIPLLHQSVDDALSICHPLAGYTHVKLVLQWTLENKEKFIIDDVDHIDEHSSVDELKKKPPECAPVSLTDCLQLHTSAEMLSCGDAWHCPTCNRKQQVLKRLNLWSAPQVLVIHLKRFKQVSLSSNSSKLNTLVNFPLTGFDISDHMAGRPNLNATSPQNALDTSTAAANKVLGGVWSPWKRPKKLCATESENIYDLYAICNHHGRDLLGGHYTAICRNPSNGKWYTFDDFSIDEISQENVTGEDAYILFYQRRDYSSSWHTCDTESKHWSYRIPLSALPSQLKIIPSNEEDSSKSTETIEEPKQNEKTTTSDDLKSETDISPMQITPTPEIITATDEELHPPTPETKDAVSLAKECCTENTKSFLTVETVKAVVNSPEIEMKHIPAQPRSEITPKASPTPSELPCTNVEMGDKPIDKPDIKGKVSPITTSASVEVHAEPECNKLYKNNTDQETIPEVRIQPASLEVLASHRYRSCSSSQRVVKVTLRPRSQDEPISRLNSIECSHSRCSSDGNLLPSRAAQITNGYLSETGSSGDEETPQVRIRNSAAMSSQNIHGMKKTNCRMSNANKTPSFVVIRTPTSSPRSIRERNVVKLNGSYRSPRSREMIPCLEASVSNDKREITPCLGKTSVSTVSKDKRPLSYSATQNGRPIPSVGPRRQLKLEKERPINHYPKTRSRSCVMECEEKEEYNPQFMTESSV